MGKRTVVATLLDLLAIRYRLRSPSKAIRGPMGRGIVTCDVCKASMFAVRANAGAGNTYVKPSAMKPNITDASTPSKSFYVV